MEEILASIRRIISEEEQTPDAVLELTDQNAAPGEADPEDDIVFEAVEPEPPAPAPTPVRSEPAPVAVREPAVVARSPETILSPPSATATAGSLARLAGTLRIAETPNQTVEGVVRELLTPMLKDWLDHNLPGIVEARVEAELERIARMVR